MSNGHAYWILEWIDGRNLVECLSSGFRVDFAVRVVMEIAGALDVLGSHGISHGDICPSNVVVRPDGSIVVCDPLFGRPARQGAVSAQNFGTLGYVAPELQERVGGGHVSDYYSLGVLFYRLLAGDLPWKTADGKRGRTRTIDDVVPQLPLSLSALQTAVAEMLVFNPIHRLSSQEILAERVEGVTESQPLPQVVLHSDIVSTGEISSVVSGPEDARLADRGRSAGMRRGTRATIVAVICGVVLIAAAIGIQSQWPEIHRMLAEIGFVEHPQLPEAWQTAEALRADPNQSLNSILAAYDRVLSLDPDHPDANAAIESAVSQWKSDARDAIGNDDLALAQTRLNDLIGLYPRDPDLSSMFDQLDTRRRVTTLLRDTRLMLERTGIENDVSATMALHAYREVIRLYPASTEAAEQLDVLADYYADKATAAAEDGEIIVAMEFFERADTANSQFPRLPLVRELINEAETLQNEIRSMLQLASEYRAAGQLIAPVETNAASLYRRVLATDPENSLASQGLSEIQTQVVLEFETLLTERDFAAIERMLSRAIEVALDENVTTGMQTQFADVKRRVERAADLVVEAQGLYSRGFITQPIESNAVELLQEARGLDPANETIEELLHLCAQRLADVAKDAYEYDLKDDAMLYLDLALAVRPGVSEWTELKDLWSAVALQ